MPQTFLLLLPLAMVALVLWPMFVAVLEICPPSFSHGTDVGLCSLLDLLHSQRSHISLFGSKRSVSWDFLIHRQRSALRATTGSTLLVCTVS